MNPSRLRIHAASLHYFNAVYSSKSIRGAARSLNIASSAVNRSILQLEAEIGIPLFRRLSDGLQPTEAGELLWQHVKTILRDAELVSSRLDELRGLRAGHIEIAALEGLCHYVLPHAVETLAQSCPNITVGVRLLDTKKIPSAIANGDVHLALAFEMGQQPEVRQLHAVKLPLGAIMAPTCKLASRKTITLEECRNVPFILPKQNFANRQQLQHVLCDSGFESWGRYESGSIELMKQLALRKLGIILMTPIGVEEELKAATLVHVPLTHRGENISSELGLYAHGTSTLPRAAEIFTSHLIKSLHLWSEK